MELNIVASRKCIIEFVNNFLENNNLVFFNDKNFEKSGIVVSSSISMLDFVDSNILINIGTKEDYEAKIKLLNHRPLVDDKNDFIYMTNFWTKNEVKITNTSFLWYPNRSPNAKHYGSILQKEIKKHYNYGMHTEDSRYTLLNKTFAKYYWSDEVKNYLDKLYNNGGVVPIRPIIE